MKSKVFIAGLLLAAVPLFVFAEGKEKNKNKDENTSVSVVTTISGQVKDARTGEALTGVLVKISETGQETYTDFDGNFSFAKIKPGEYNVVAKMISYQNHIKNIKASTKREKVVLKMTKK